MSWCCWWKKSCTSWGSFVPLFTRFYTSQVVNITVLTTENHDMSGGGFLPSQVLKGDEVLLPKKLHWFTHLKWDKGYESKWLGNIQMWCFTIDTFRDLLEYTRNQTKKISTPGKMAQLPCIAWSWPLTNRHLLGVAIAIYFHHSVSRQFKTAFTTVTVVTPWTHLLRALPVAPCLLLFSSACFSAPLQGKDNSRMAEDWNSPKISFLGVSTVLHIL